MVGRGREWKGDSEREREGERERGEREREEREREREKGREREREREKGREREREREKGRKGERERERGCEATHFFLAKFPQSLRAFALIPSFISHILLYIIKTFLKWACARLFYFQAIFFIGKHIVLHAASFALHYLSLDAALPERGRVENGGYKGRIRWEFVSSLPLCKGLCVIIFPFIWRWPPLC